MAWLAPPRCPGGSWRAVWWSPGGRRRRRKRERALSPHEATARRILAELNAQALRQRMGLARSVPMRQLRDEFLKSMVADGAAPTYLQRVRIVFGHLERHYPNLRTGALTADLLDDYKVRRRGDGVEGSTLNREIGIIKTAARKGRRWAFQIQDLSDVSKVKVMEKVKSAYARSDLRALLKAARPLQVTGLYLGLYAGLRRSEILALRWADVDFEQNRIVIGTNWATKTRKPRAVPMHPRLREYLLRLRKRCRPRLDDRVVPWTKTPQHFTGQFTDLRRRLGIDRGSWHRLRHTFVTFLKRRDVDTAKAQRLAGQTTEKVTQGYTHLEVKDLEPAVRRLRY